MSAKVYVEGGGDSKDLHSRCREGFRRLFEKCGFKGRMPRLVACGGREDAYDDFTSAHGATRGSDYVALLVDSEEPVADIERIWDHLRHHDGWSKPTGAYDGQALLMTTCMETWVAADRGALREHFGHGLQESALPSSVNMESRPRHQVQDGLENATRKCKGPYEKGKRSFEVLGKLDPAVLRQHLPSFSRCVRVLGENL